MRIKIIWLKYTGKENTDGVYDVVDDKNDITGLEINFFVREPAGD